MDSAEDDGLQKHHRCVWGEKGDMNGRAVGFGGGGKGRGEGRANKRFKPTTQTRKMVALASFDVANDQQMELLRPTQCSGLHEATRLRLLYCWLNLPPVS